MLGADLLPVPLPEKKSVISDMIAALQANKASHMPGGIVMFFCFINLCGTMLLM